jgi:nitronate monooxygenase
MRLDQLPRIIQGGMGVGVSNWQLARTVSRSGQLGVVSGTALDHVMAMRLMDGDEGGFMRQALAAFPMPEAAQKILDRYFDEGGRPKGKPYRSVPNYAIKPGAFLHRLTTIANFAEVFLAKQGHEGLIGMNRLEKIQLPTLASLYGAMLAGVDFILMGAGIPTQVAGILDKLARHEKVAYRLDVKGAERGSETVIEFDPQALFPGIAEKMGTLKRPKFLPIISSVVLAMALIKRSEGEVDGFVVEAPIAGGHNAPPRGKLSLTESGEPIYGEKDLVNFEQLAGLGKPFWLAGGYGRPGGLKIALDAGAAGIQVGTAFAMCNESGIEPGLKQEVIDMVRDGTANVFTSPDKSPTGFPFKMARVPGTMSDDEVYESRSRICDVGMLRSMAATEDGDIVYLCASEPEEDFERKGGSLQDTVGRSCLCNNLLATIGLAKPRKDGSTEQPIVTSGDDLTEMGVFFKNGSTSYSAADVIDVLLEG